MKINIEKATGITIDFETRDIIMETMEGMSFDNFNIDKLRVENMTYPDKTKCGESYEQLKKDIHAIDNIGETYKQVEGVVNNIIDSQLEDIDKKYNNGFAKRFESLKPKETSKEEFINLIADFYLNSKDDTIEREILKEKLSKDYDNVTQLKEVGDEVKFSTELTDPYPLLNVEELRDNMDNYNKDSLSKQVTLGALLALESPVEENNNPKYFNIFRTANLVVDEIVETYSLPTYLGRIRIKDPYLLLKLSVSDLSSYSSQNLNKVVERALEVDKEIDSIEDENIKNMFLINVDQNYPELKYVFVSWHTGDQRYYLHSYLLGTDRIDPREYTGVPKEDIKQIIADKPKIEKFSGLEYIKDSCTGFENDTLYHFDHISSINASKMGPQVNHSSETKHKPSRLAMVNRKTEEQKKIILDSIKNIMRDKKNSNIKDDTIKIDVDDLIMYLKNKDVINLSNLELIGKHVVLSSSGTMLQDDPNEVIFDMSTLCVSEIEEDRIFPTYGTRLPFAEKHFIIKFEDSKFSSALKPATSYDIEYSECCNLKAKELDEIISNLPPVFKELFIPNNSKGDLKYVFKPLDPINGQRYIALYITNPDVIKILTEEI